MISSNNFPFHIQRENILWFNYLLNKIFWNRSFFVLSSRKYLFNLSFGKLCQWQKTVSEELWCTFMFIALPLDSTAGKVIALDTSVVLNQFRAKTPSLRWEIFEKYLEKTQTPVLLKKKKKVQQFSYKCQNSFSSMLMMLGFFSTALCLDSFSAHWPSWNTT